MILAREDKTYDGAQRGHYELAAGRDVQPLIRAIEGLTQLLPGQVWALPDSPKPTWFLDVRRETRCRGMAACRDG